MKSILLASASIVAFAGAAQAEVIWAADAEFGYNEEVEGGFYFDGGLGVVAAAELDMGLEAGIALDVDLGFSENEDDGVFNSFGGSFSGISVNASDFVVFVQTTDMDSAYAGGLYIGDTETASQQIWNGTTNMETDGFLEVGDVDDGADDGDFVDGVLRGDLTFGSVDMSVSYFIADNGDVDTDDVDALEGLQVGARTVFGNFEVGAVYQEEVPGRIVNAVDSSPGDDGIVGTDDDIAEEPGTIDELFGVYAGTTVYGADLTVAYSENLTTEASSLGFEVGYAIGPVVATAFYSLEQGPDGDDDAVDDNYGVQMAYSNGPISVLGYYHDGTDEEIGIEGSYTFDAITFYAGYIDNRDDIDDNYEAYAAMEYGLSDAATVFAAYGESGDGYTGANDEIGNAYEVNEGTTVGISFTF
ncbi:porin [Wenxinia saemankumensis]|uniref:Porin n=1 Tax=Wenxinia saemankumensis TaxID=1447782 RepID=A0A1M6FWT2_9RHOB|nr:porin [Wenxinia saemankumensis]SHJ02175.1 hypothetical protein SAMN05444417_2547 [Wenxinia saemankumensis]